MTTAATVLAGLDQIRPDLESLYEHLHAHPELSNQEAKTAALMAERLRAAGLEVHEQVGASTGVVGILRNGEGPVVLLRADMDGLPVQEEEKVPYRSTDTGTWEGKQVPTMHACGHDTHMTALQGAVQLLAGSPDAWSGTLVALFQPAEEIVDGAKNMVEPLKQIVPHLDVALGQHVWPAAAGEVQTAAGPIMASTDSLKIRLSGRGGHGSQPENTIDPVVLAAHIVVRLQTIVSREVAPQDLAVVTVGSLHAGSKANIIPATAEIDLNIRAYDQGIREKLQASIIRIVEAECQATGGASATFEWSTATSVTDNDPEATQRLQQAFDTEFGHAHKPLTPVLGSEDFGVIAEGYGAPSVFWFFGGFDPETYYQAVERGTIAEDMPSNHAPNFIPLAQPTLDTGVRALVTGSLAWLGK